ncbi:hemolysin family protein [Fundidesulfovibrio butyratiphilus]
MLELILAVVIALVMSSFCSVSEAVLYSLRWSWIERLRVEHKKSGEILYNMRMNVEKPITAILTVNTVACSAGATVAGALAVQVLGENQMVYFTIVFSAIILIFGEILPKTVGVAYTRSLAPYLARPLQVMVVVLSPLIWALGFLARLVSPKSKGPEATEEDIRAMVSLTRRAGKIKAMEERSIFNILSLDTKTASDVMTPRTVVLSLPAEATVTEVRQNDPLLSHSRLPVYAGDDPDDVVGIVTRKQILEALANDQHDTLVSDLMGPVQFVLETMTLDRVLVEFLDARMHLFVVLDEYGGMQGVISLEDVLEEILGKEIVDETDQVADMRELARVRRETLLRALPVAREK